MVKKPLLFLPGPVTVAEPVLAALARPLINHRGPEFEALLSRITDALRPIFGTKSEIVLLGSSGTGAMEAAVANAFTPGDVLLACPIGVFGTRFAAIAEAFGCTVEILETASGAAVDPQALAERLRGDRARRYAGILLTHNETSTGVQNDMALLAPIVREHGALTIVDSVSGLGASEFKMDGWGYDVVVSASQKVLAAPPGVAMVGLGPRAFERFQQARAPRFYFDLAKAVEFARKGQTPWTPPISILYALDTALERYHHTGAPEVWSRHELYANAVRAALEVLGFTVFSKPGAHSATVVVAYPPERVDAAALLKSLRERRGIMLAGGQGELTGKVVRMGTMGDISQTDVLGAIGAIEIALLEADVPVNVGTGVQAALRVFLGMASEARADVGVGV